MRRLCAALAALVVLAASTARDEVSAQSAATVTILHINDVYEIDAIEGGRFGGLARVATVLQQLERTRPPVLMTLGGDYLSPSAIGTAVVDGQPLAGRQMVDVLNRVGLDWAVFGNHEFDITETAFRARVAESRFRTVASNVSDISGQPFAGTVRSAVVPLRAGRRTVRLGLIGLTVELERRPWARYSPPIDAARAQIAALKGHVDAIVALTHLSLAADEALVAEVPEIDLVLGGHEHENWLLQRGPSFTPIVKADANARSVAVVTLTLPGDRSRPTVATRFQSIDDRVAHDPKVQAVVRTWTEAAYAGFRKSGFEPDNVVAVTTEPLDGRESVVRHQPGRLTDLILRGFEGEAGGADVTLLNGGSIRLDDVIPPGPVTEYDVIRVLPFGGRVTRATFGGRLLTHVLEIGRTNRGNGGYLHVLGASQDGDRWVIDGRPIDPAGRYSVALSDFLLSGGETNLGFLTRTNPDVQDVRDLRDVRMAFIDALRVTYGPK